jgi:AcrR family transcriptional regulator
MEETKVNKKTLQSEETKSRILEAAAELFSVYGYADTTTRMVSEKAGVVLSSLNHYFGSKENLLEEVLDDMAEKVSSKYEPIRDKIEDYLEGNQYTEEQTYDLIEELIRKHVQYCFDLRNKSIIDMVSRECLFPRNVSISLAKVMCEEIEIPLANLLMQLTISKNKFEIVTLCRSINGAIVTFAENPELVEELYKSFDLQPDYKTIEDIVYIDMMKLIEASVMGASKYRKG